MKQKIQERIKEQEEELDDIKNKAREQIQGKVTEIQTLEERIEELKN